MRIDGICACGAKVEISGSGGKPDHWEDARLMETFTKWREAHKDCAALYAPPKLDLEVVVPPVTEPAVAAAA